MKYFTKIVDVMIKFMIPIVIIALLMGIARVVLDLRAVFGSETIAAGFDRMVTNILSMFIVIELLRSIIEYFAVHRLKITFITDAALVFVLREIMIGLRTQPGGENDHCAAALIPGSGLRRLRSYFHRENIRHGKGKTWITV
jgi:uncharacterized membrane protein (DUF373 family)